MPGFKTETASLITMIVSQILNAPGAREREYVGEGNIFFKTGLLFDITLEVKDESIDDYEKMEDGKSLKRFYMAFCGNTSVFVASQDDEDDEGLRYFEAIPSDDWENLSNHDSCWRDAVRSFLIRQYFEMCDEVHPDMRPRDLTSECSIGLCNLWRNVQIVTGNDPDPERDNYWRKLVSIKPE